MNRYIFLSLLFITANLWSNVTLNIYYNSYSCSNCNISFNLLRNVNPKVEKILFLLEKNKPYEDEILIKYNFQTTDFKINYLDDDHFTCKKKPCKEIMFESYCLLIAGQTKIDSFLLKHLSEKIKFINSEFELIDYQNTLTVAPASMTSKTFILNKINNRISTLPTSYSITIPDSIKLSDQIQFTRSNGIINLRDQLLNKNVTLFLNADYTKIDKILLVKGESFKPKPFMKLNCFDTIEYKKCFPVLKKQGAHIIKIETAYVNDSTINLFLNCTFPIIKGNDTLFDMKYFIYTKNFKNDRTSLLCLKTNQLAKGFWLSSLPFFIVANKAYISVRNYDEGDEKNVLAEYNILNGQLEFEKILENKAGIIKNNRKAEGIDLNKYVNAEFYFVNTFPYLYDYKNKAEFIFPEKDFFTDKSQEYYINDILRVNNRIYLLVILGKDVYTLIYDASTKLLVEKKKLPIDQKYDTNLIRFNNEYSYILLDKRCIHFVF